MKKLLFLFIVVIMLLVGHALAANPYALPEDIAAVFDCEQWNGYQPVFNPRYHTIEGYESGAFYAVILQKDGINTLCVLEKVNGALSGRRYGRN